MSAAENRGIVMLADIAMAAGIVSRPRAAGAGTTGERPRGSTRSSDDKGDIEHPEGVMGGQPVHVPGAIHRIAGVDAALHRPVVPAREEKEPTKAAQKTIRRAILNGASSASAPQPQSWGGFPAGSMIVITSLEPP